MSEVLPHLEITPQRPDWVAGEEIRTYIYLNYPTNLRRFRKWAIRDSLRSYERRTYAPPWHQGRKRPARAHDTAADLTATWE